MKSRYKGVFPLSGGRGLARCSKQMPWVLIVASFLLCGCSRPLPLQVLVPPGATIEKGQPVYVDEVLAGEVASVTQEGGDHVANLLIKDASAKQMLKVGSLYLPSTGKVQITTEAVEPGAQLLPRGSRIASSSALGIMVKKWSTKSTVMSIGVALAAVVVLWLVFRSLVGTAGLILCAALAAVLTQAVFFHAIPYVEKVLNRIGPPAAENQALATPEPPAKPAPQGDVVLPSPGEVIQKAHASIQEMIVSRPSPAVVTWCILFVGLFILLNIVLGKVARVWKS